MNKKPNVILITIDALRKDKVSCMVNNGKLTPEIDKFADDSVIFKNAFSVGPTTPYSFPAILTSTYPLDFNGPEKMEAPRVFLSEVFEKNGYKTAAFHSSPYLSEFFGYNKGWNFFEDIAFPVNFSSKSRRLEKFLRKLVVLFFPPAFFTVVYLNYRMRGIKQKRTRAPIINQAIKDFITSQKDSDQPFFLWAHYMDTHTPPLCYAEGRTCSYSEILGDSMSSAIWSFGNKMGIKRYAKGGFKKHLPKIVSAYEKAIEYTDARIGEIVDFLKKENVYSDSVICVTSDHGDEFGEHDGMGHNTQLYNEVLAVPLILKLNAPIRQNYQEKIIDKKVSLIDLAPTLCDIAGIHKDASFKGGNLFKENGAENIIFHQSAFSEKDGTHLDIKDLSQCKIACQSDGFKYILDHRTKKEELYDLKNDPGEKNDISKNNKDILSKMRNKIEKFQKENPPLSKL